MKIEQNLLTGKIRYYLNSDETYDINNHLQALSDFVESQAVETFRHTKEYRKLVGRLDELEGRLSDLQNQLNEKERI
jgi:polyhydroxyalkanoate synthesis regulator phasin